MRKIGLTERKKINRGVAKEAVVKERADVSSEKNRKIFVGSIIVLLIFAFLFCFIITSTFAVKPDLTKLSLVSSSDIGSDHVNWVLNEVGAYKLHSYLLLGEAPVIESIITDQNKKFTTTVIDNYPTTVDGVAVNPDIRFSMNSANFITLYQSSDTLTKAQEMKKAGLIKIDILKEWFTMLVKGYRAIYDALPG